MFVYSVQIICRLDNQIKFQMFTSFPSRHIGVLKLYTNMAAPYTGLCKFVHNVSTNIWSLEKRMDLKLGEVTSLIIFYNIAISWLHPPNGFQFHFLLRDSAAQELEVRAAIVSYVIIKFFFSCKVLISGNTRRCNTVENIHNHKVIGPWDRVVFVRETEGIIGKVPFFWSPKTVIFLIFIFL